MPAPFLRRLAQHRCDRAPVGNVAALRGLEGAQPIHHTPTLLEIGFPKLRARLEKIAARLVRRDGGLVKALPIRLRIADDSLADRLPVVLQLLDSLCERFGLFLRPDQRLHLLDQLGALGRGRMLFPLLEIVQCAIELEHLLREVRRNGRQRRELLFDGTAQTRRAARISLAKRVVNLADQSADLT